MSRHKLFVANGVFPRFGSTPSRYRNPFAPRARRIAGLVGDSGADCATFGELGRPECATLAGYMPSWQYDRAQGGPQEGLNSAWTHTKAWSQPEAGLSDYSMPSAGQWTRTLILARITELSDPTAFVQLGAFHSTLTNAGGLAYVRALIDKVGERRVLLAGDLKRTGDDDDIALLKRNGYTLHERRSSTPMVAMTQGKVEVHDVVHKTDPRAFDHGYLVVDFSIYGAAPAAGKKAA